jgi:hypothetical protein
MAIEHDRAGAVRAWQPRNDVLQMCGGDLAGIQLGVVADTGAFLQLRG